MASALNGRFSSLTTVLHWSFTDSIATCQQITFLITFPALNNLDLFLFHSLKLIDTQRFDFFPIVLYLTFTDRTTQIFKKFNLVPRKL